MAGLNADFSIGMSTTKTPDKIDDIGKQIEALNSSIPEVTTTKEQKQRAIQVKKQIIALMLKQLQQAKAENNTSLASSITEQIKVVDQEMNTIKNELSAMIDIFNSKPSGNNSNVSIFNK